MFVSVCVDCSDVVCCILGSCRLVTSDFSKWTTFNFFLFLYVVEANIGSEDSSLSDALVLDDGESHSN